MSNPRIEEVSDDEDVGDPEEMDLDAFDFAKPQSGGLKPAMDPTQSQISQDALQSLLQQQNQAGPSGRAMPNPAQMSRQDLERLQREHQQKSKNYQCIYPVYFDSTRSREEGRRVSKEDAVPNPLAREIVDALQHIGQVLNIPLDIAMEPAKMHPKDWANPGRVKVLVKKDGKPVSKSIPNKSHLFKMIADYLKKNPTTEATPNKLRIQGMPLPKVKIAPAIPRGFKIGTILPLHSPALSGGGVSDNMFEDMMNEMGGQLPPGMEAMANMANSPGPAKPKKIKVMQRR